MADRPAKGHEDAGHGRRRCAGATRSLAANLRCGRAERGDGFEAGGRGGGFGQKSQGTGRARNPLRKECHCRRRRTLSQRRATCGPPRRTFLPAMGLALPAGRANR